MPLFLTLLVNKLTNKEFKDLELDLFEAMGHLFTMELSEQYLKEDNVQLDLYQITRNERLKENFSSMLIIAAAKMYNIIYRVNLPLPCVKFNYEKLS